MQPRIVPQEFPRSLARRRWLARAGALALAAGWPAWNGWLQGADAADLNTGLAPLADAHSHIGLHERLGYAGSLKADMQAAGLTLLAWTIVGDARWTSRTDKGILQRATPRSGEQSRYFRQKLFEMKRYLAAQDLAPALRPEDIDAARSGSPRVVIALEGAGFLEDGLSLIDEAYAGGLRHLQLVHYVHNAIGDFQTVRPEHNGMTELGVQVVKACNRLGILVDLAHGTNAVIDRVLEVSTTPPIWSHSDLSATQTGWTQSPGQARRLYIDYAKKIAQRGGAVGLWSSRSRAVPDIDGYARELLRMVDAIGPEHVMMGSDTDGLGPGGGVIHTVADLRAVAEALRRRGVDERTFNAVCFENYARCLRAAMQGRQA